MPIPDGQLKLKIKPETQNGRKIRLTGRGMPHVKDPATKGDLYATVSVRLPLPLTDEERTLFEELRALRP